MASFSSFDTRRYRTVTPREGYERWAGTYEIDGVDLSPAMLEAARARGVYASLAEGEAGESGA